jgi:hypothetical protein
MASPRKNVLKLVYVSNNAMEAEEARCLLAGSGIDAVIFDSHLVALNPFLGGAVGGVKVMVPENQLERASAALTAAGRAPGGLPATGDSFHPYADIMKGMSANEKRWALGIVLGLVGLIAIATFILSINSAYYGRIDGKPVLRVLVARTGFEPVIFALRGRRPRPLDERATRTPRTERTPSYHFRRC